jgi:pimeloyl-ACP methyl ester carboxylesterase
MARGQLREKRSEAAGVTYYLYVPAIRNASVPLFVTIHGWSRNALEHAQLFLPFAESLGVALLAPLFDRLRFPWYQRLGTSERKGRADKVLDILIEEAGRSARLAKEPIFLFGYSGGGQFASRYAMAYPERVARVALGAPGWYTFPDPGQPYPWGIGASRNFPGLSFEPPRFLKVPAKVLVGEFDTLRGRNLNTSRTVDRMQGLDRQERGRRWVQAMTAAARACNLDTEYTLELLPGAEHSFTRCMEAGRMGEIVFNFLFGRRAKRPGRH